MAEARWEAAVQWEAEVLLHAAVAEEHPPAADPRTRAPEVAEKVVEGLADETARRTQAPQLT